MGRNRTGSIVALPDRSGYRVRWFDPVRSLTTGRRVYPSQIVRGSKADARQLLRQKLDAADRGRATAPQRQCLSDYLDAWLGERAAASRVRPRTIASYSEVIRLYVKEQPIGRIALSRLSHEDIAKLYASLRQRENKRPLSSRTVRYLHSLLNAALLRAVRRGLLARNPAEEVELPRQANRAIVALTPNQVSQLLTAARALDCDPASRFRRLYPLVLLLAMTGLRPGEALGLTWADFDGSSITVRRSLTRLKKEWALSDPKTSNSRRTIPLHVQVVDALKSHKAAQAAERLRAGPGYADHELIFASEVGTPLDHKNLVHRYFAAVLKRAGLPHVRVYDLRHACATALLAAERNPKLVAERLGHSSIRTTLDVYAHVLPGQQERATEVLGEIFLGKTAAS